MIEDFQKVNRMENKEIEKKEVSVKEKMDKDIKDIQKKASKDWLTAKMFLISDQKTYDESILMRSNNKDQLKIIEKKFEKMRKDAHSAWKGIIALVDELSMPYHTMNNELIESGKTFLKTEEEKRIAAEAEAEKIRIAEEEKEKAELDAQAEEAMDNGDFEKAEDLIEESENTFIAPTVITTVNSSVKDDTGKVKSSATPIYKYFITDLRKILEASINDRLPVFKEKPMEISLSKNEIKKYVEMRAYDEKTLNEIGLRRERDFSTRIY